jgi:predicted phosphodiesterase
MSQSRSTHDHSHADALRIAYTADWHVLEVKGGAPVNQMQRLKALVDRLNEEAPDLVIHGGDLITRYSVDQLPLPDHAIRGQYQQIDTLLGALQSPIALFPGNHDVAFPVCREEWQRRFGKPGNGSTWDRSLALGPVHLVMMDGFALYDPETGEQTGCSLTTEQIAWLEQECRSAETSVPWRILALHYDYSDQVLPRLAELGIDCFLYGHSSAHRADAFETSGCRNGHLPGSSAYRILTITANDFQIDLPVAYDTFT